MVAAMIPRRLHRIWLGPYRMPEAYVAHARQWEDMGWPVLDWCWPELDKLPMSDRTREVLADIEENGASVGGGLEAVGKWVQQADVLAYEIVRHVGGIVANCDIEPLQDVGPLIDGLDGFVVAEDDRFLSNALIGGIPDHPFWCKVSDELPDRFWSRRWEPMNAVTGPHHLTECWLFADNQPTRLEPVPFFPVRFDDERRYDDGGRPTGGFYVDHRWGHKHPELLEVRSEVQRGVSLR